MGWTGSQWVAVGGLAALGALAVYAMVDSIPSRRGDETMNATERAWELAKVGKREQVVTYTTGMTPLDENAGKPASLHVIGVGQFTLGEAEQIESFGYASRANFRPYNGSASWGLYSSESPDTYSMRGPFNNLLLYDDREGATRKVFEARISVTEFVVLGDPKTPRLAIFAAGTDTNGDARLDESDLQDFYIFLPLTNALHKIALPGASAIRIVKAPGAGSLVIQAAIDRNKDGIITHQYDKASEIEPHFLYRVDLNSFKATPLVSEEMTRSLQQTLDGTNDRPRTR